MTQHREPGPQHLRRDSVAHGVLLITLSRPDVRNQLRHAAMTELADALETADRALAAGLVSEVVAHGARRWRVL